MLSHVVTLIRYISIGTWQLDCKMHDISSFCFVGSILGAYFQHYLSRGDSASLFPFRRSCVTLEWWTRWTRKDRWSYVDTRGITRSRSSPAPTTSSPSPPLGTRSSHWSCGVQARARRWLRVASSATFCGWRLTSALLRRASSYSCQFQEADGHTVLHDASGLILWTCSYVVVSE